MAIAGGCAQKDLDKAMAIVDEGERVLAVWKATPEQALSEACMPCQLAICLPCIIPMCIMIFPVAIGRFMGESPPRSNVMTELAQ